MPLIQLVISVMWIGNAVLDGGGSLRLKLLSDHLFLVAFCLVWIRGWRDSVALGNGVTAESQFRLHDVSIVREGGKYLLTSPLEVGRNSGGIPLG